MFKVIEGSRTFSYKGLRMMANPDLHESVLNLIKKYKLSLESKILILGAGSGAFDQRLLDVGFSKITSVDIDEKNYGIKNQDVRFIRSNLNENFAKIVSGKFDLIICLEIIEHLHSPFQFIKNCGDLVADDGVILISTPNVHDGISRAHNLLFGYPSLFLSPPEEFGHISPLFRKIFEHYLSLNSLRIVKVIGVSSFFKYLNIYSYKSYFYYLVVLLAYIALLPILLFSLNKSNGLLSIYVIKKAHQEQ